jgi:hypothetical protein
VRPAAIFVALCACTTFQNPDIVVDIRVIAMDADLPEQVIDVDFVNPPPPAQVLSQIQPATVCALVADPYNMRDLRWSMTLCNYSESERCIDGDPQELLGSGVEPDPDVTDPEPAMCATVQPDDGLVAVVQHALSNDDLHGLQGVDYSVVLRVGGVGGDPTLDLYASKILQLAANDPPDRVANTNPYLDHVEVAVGDNDSEDLSTPVTLPLGRCLDQASPWVAPAGKKVRINPIEPPGVRETYVLPTLDGKSETFTESLTYQWTATAGQFDNDATGGPRDLAGNDPPLFTDWFTPSDRELKGSAEDVTLWIVQRDERFGVHWYESCIRVQP